MAPALLAALSTTGCGQEQKADVTRVAEPLEVRVTQPESRDLVRVVGQPSFVESYERTSIYPKLSAYIKKWHVDIGDKVKKDQVLADLFVPEVEEDCQTRLNALELAEEQVRLAKEKVKVADADVEVAAAHLEAAKDILDQYEAQVARWDKEVERLTREAKQRQIDARVLYESDNQLKSSHGARDAALAEIERAEADLQSKTATLQEDDVGVEVAEAAVEVARHDYLRVKALVDWYLKLYAPFDGVIVARNADTWDFVLPARGDPTADRFRDPDRSPSGQAAPVYVVDRTDVLRVFVDVPEHDANFVHAGTKATVLAMSFCEEPIVGTVTRTSWALNVKSRTLRAEIDLPNVGSKVPDDLPKSTREALTQVEMPRTDSEILPGMYADAEVIIERPQVLALPVSALSYSSDRTFCWFYEDGKAVRTEVETGVSDGKWIEVTNHRLKAGDGGVHNASLDASPAAVGETQRGASLDEDDAWVPFDGSEQVIVGNLSVLTDGAAVQVGSAKHGAEASRAAPNGI